MMLSQVKRLIVYIVKVRLKSPPRLGSPYHAKAHRTGRSEVEYVKETPNQPYLAARHRAK